MKRHNILEFAVALIVAGTACTKIDILSYEERAEISYQAVVSTLTKAAMDGAVYDTSVPFRSMVFWNPDGDSIRANSSVWVPDSEVSYVGNRWTTQEKYYWPTVGGSLTFMAFSPSYVPVHLSENGLELDWDSSAGDNRSVDLMMADIQTGKTVTRSADIHNGVPTVFRHILSCIKVSAAAEEGADIVIKSVSFSNVYTKAHFSSDMGGENWGELRPMWSDLDGRGEMDLGASATRLEAGYRQIGGMYMAIPQACNEEGGGIQMVIVYDDLATSEGDITIRLSLGESKSLYWERAKKVHYMITFGTGDKPINFTAAFGDWEYMNQDDIVVGVE